MEAAEEVQAIKCVLKTMSELTDNAQDARIIMKKSLAFLSGVETTPKDEKLQKIFDYLDFSVNRNSGR